MCNILLSNILQQFTIQNNMLFTDNYTEQHAIHYEQRAIREQLHRTTRCARTTTDRCVLMDNHL